MSDEPVHQGGCLCGKIRYRARGAPKWCAHCHCGDCRRASGGVFVTWAGFEDSRFEIVKGEPVRHHSSPGVTRRFCADCGSPFTYESERWPGEVHIAVGSLDKPDDVPPQGHVYTDQRLSWLRVDEHLPGRAGTGS